MKRWLPLVAVIFLLWVGFTGCATSDDSSSSSSDGGATADATADGGGFAKGDSATNSDATLGDSGEEASVVDSGEDGAVLDAGEDSGIDAGFDAGPADAGPPFDVTAAASLDDVTATVTFDAPPNPAQATTISNYVLSGGLTVSAAVLGGNVVTLTTSTQTAIAYTATVSNVTRDADARTLTTDHASFTGRGAFDVSSAASTGSTSVTVTFDAAPDPTSANTASNYGIPGLTVSAAVLSGNVVTLTTTAQTPITFTVTVSNVTRASDGEALSINHVDFTGAATFNVVSATSTSSTTVDVLYDAPPNATSAIVTANYPIAGLTISNATLTGSTVTLTTSAQGANSYSLTVANVTRASDGAVLDNALANFTGTPPAAAPTVTNVVVASTNPNNSTTPYNTGTSTLTITGTDFSSVSCPTGVKLDNLDGLGNAVSTKPTSCTVDSNTQITAVFPSGIRTNGSTGWNVLVTNSIGSNTSSTVKFVPVAGLLISEVLISTTMDTDDEFIEIYNPTGTAIDTTIATGIGLRLHQRASTGTDTNKTLTLVGARTGSIPSHGFILIVSSVSITNAESWATKADYKYSAAFGANGGAYISMSATAQTTVLDKVGWGSQPVGGFEGTAISPTIATNDSVQRKPAGGAGDATDTDVNSADFNAQSTSITPKGSTDAVEP